MVAGKVYPPGVFDAKLASDYVNEYTYDIDIAYTNMQSKGTHIAEWAAAILGIDAFEASFLFFQMGDTAETIGRINWLLEGNKWIQYPTLSEEETSRIIDTADL
jgi:hypothetical protein